MGNGYEGSFVYVKMTDMRRILHIDMDSFLSSVEQKRHPERIGKPVVIGEGEIRRAAFGCLGRFELKKRVRLTGVRISNLEKEGITP